MQKTYREKDASLLEILLSKMLELPLRLAPRLKAPNIEVEEGLKKENRREKM